MAKLQDCQFIKFKIDGKELKGASKKILIKTGWKVMPYKPSSILRDRWCYICASNTITFDD